MADGLGICADGSVESVLLQCQCPLGQVRTINLDPASRTSNLLLTVLLRRHFHVRHNISLGMGAPNADACVMIGDRALCADSALP
jgi:predicted solute-binding protein